jgi:hypothetical protein
MSRFLGCSIAVLALAGCLGAPEPVSVESDGCFADCKDVKATFFDVGYELPDAQTDADTVNNDSSASDAGSDAMEQPPSSTEVTAPGCPSVYMSVTSPEVMPGTVVHLTGSATPEAGGAITGFKWTLAKPPGSLSAFLPNDTTPNSAITPDVAGTYHVCLAAAQTPATAACPKACLDVVAVEPDAVNIELYWDTPADPDQTDTGPAAGADLDLHFANYLASGPDIDCDGTGDPWFNIPFDCFWGNYAPQWGSASPLILDDPILSANDTDGAGPEFVRLAHPEGDPSLPRFYSIGVHYWNAHGYGVSYASVTVFLYGAIALKIDHIAMNPLDMWHIGKLNWPNQLTGTSMPPLSVCYQTPGSQPGDVCQLTAKMWQDQGEWCMTPCYVNPGFAATTGGTLPTNCNP